MIHPMASRTDDQVLVEVHGLIRVVPIELKISALSDLQTPRQQMSQFWSEDFAAHILQTSSFRTSEDSVSDVILFVRRTLFDVILEILVSVCSYFSNSVR